MLTDEHNLDFWISRATNGEPEISSLISVEVSLALMKVLCQGHRNWRLYMSTWIVGKRILVRKQVEQSILQLCAFSCRRLTRSNLFVIE